jgi:Arc/MetJ-type ribon-helix-helix transcriptional regulator
VKDENSASDVVIEALLLMTGKELDRLEKSEAEVDDETRSELDVVSEDEIVALE